MEMCLIKLVVLLLPEQIILGSPDAEHVGLAVSVAAECTLTEAMSQVSYKF